MGCDSNVRHVYDALLKNVCAIRRCIPNGLLKGSRRMSARDATTYIYSFFEKHPGFSSEVAILREILQNFDAYDDAVMATLEDGDVALMKLIYIVKHLQALYDELIDRLLVSRSGI